MSMLKKLLPAVLGALLVASPVIAVTTAAAQGAMATQTAPMKSHHKAAKHKKASHHAKHAKKAKKAPKA
jgi:hypothetical protein